MAEEKILVSLRDAIVNFDIRLLISHLIHSEITALNPLEVKAGMDVLRLKEEYYDKLTFVGGIDIHGFT
ncbi:MAG: hypothetical protein QXX08_03330 [Candidatus Bathyarchaeia archaeon]